MIKQNFNVSDEERRRILNLHESATKRQYLLPEQIQDVSQTGIPFEELEKQVEFENGKPKVTQETFTFNFNFMSGFHSENATGSDGSTTITTQVNNLVQELTDRLEKLAYPRITQIVVSAGESAVPNKDNEAAGNPRLNPGQLAEMRTQTIQRSLTSALRPLVQNNLVRSIPQITVTDPVIGTATVRNSAEAIAEQFVRVSLTLEGLVTKQDNCNLNVKIKVEYRGVDFSNDKYHACDFAQFTLLLNNIPIPCVETKTDVFSLNNASDAGPRKQTLVVSGELSQQILAVSETVSVAFRCKSSQCHEAPLLMTIYSLDTNQIVSGPEYMGTAKYRGDRMPENDVRVVATMDKCGKLIDVGDYYKGKESTSQPKS